jgi:hypothetical protein
MSDQNTPSDTQLLSRLRRRKSPLTAKELGVTSQRLRGIEGIVEVGRVSTGKAGRPAILFTSEDKLSAASDSRLTNDTSDETEAIRSGALSAEVVTE